MATDLYEYVAESRNVTLEVDIPTGLQAMVDPVRIQQVISNLLDKAIKYSTDGSVVSVTAGSIVSTKEVWLAIRDQGIGIAPHDLPRIWDRLYRGDQSRSETGHGLGLSLVKAIVEAHHGRVEVQSEPGRGSTFKVVLPATDGHALQEDGGAHRRVLL